jgi:spermidine synthase
MSTKITPSFGLQAVLFNEDRIEEPFKAQGSLEFVKKQNAKHVIYDTDGCTYTVLRTLIDYTTPYQKIEIVVTPKYGKLLLLDGVVMSSEVDQAFYHEHLVVPALYDLPLNNVLVLGIGPRGILRPLVELNPTHITTVDIDKEATQIYKHYLPEWFPNDVVKPTIIHSIIDDAFTFLIQQHQHNTNNDSYVQKYDAIICDFTFGADTFTDDFILMLKRLLTPTGRVVAHYGPASFLDDSTKLVKQKFAKQFEVVKTWNAFVPSFGDCWGWITAFDNYLYHDAGLGDGLKNMQYLKSAKVINHLLNSPEV